MKWLAAVLFCLTIPAANWLIGNVGTSAPVCPERMARRIDAVQCPIRWVARPEQTDMFAA